MPLRLEALPALYGDALLLHYDSGLIIIDGGPRTVYANALRRRLEQLREQRSRDEPLPVRLVIVSHIDDDHIKGILDLATELTETAGRKLVAVQELWHNTFNDLLDDADDQYLTGAGAAASIPSIIASIHQGKQLQAMAANKLGWVINDDRPLIEAGTGDDTVDVAKNLALTILGPPRKRLIALRNDWIKTVKPSGSANAVEYLDRSIPNLASIIVLATDGKKKILLTGDARGDCILEGIENANLMKDGRYPVDVLKMPHHGSIRGLERELFERLPARDYVISANGKYDNPDIASLELLISARGNEEYNIHLTYPVEAFVDTYDRAALQALIDGSQTRRYKIIPRDPRAASVVV